MDVVLGAVVVVVAGPSVLTGVVDDVHCVVGAFFDVVVVRSVGTVGVDDVHCVDDGGFDSLVSTLVVGNELVFDVGFALEGVTDKDTVGNCVV